MYVTKKMCPHLKIVSVLQLSHIFSKGAAEIFFFFLRHRKEENVLGNNGQLVKIL